MQTPPGSPANNHDAEDFIFRPASSGEKCSVRYPDRANNRWHPWTKGKLLGSCFFRFPVKPIYLVEHRHELTSARRTGQSYVGIGLATEMDPVKGEQIGFVQHGAKFGCEVKSSRFMTIIKSLNLLTLCFPSWSRYQPTPLSLITLFLVASGAMQRSRIYLPKLSHSTR